MSTPQQALPSDIAATLGRRSGESRRQRSELTRRIVAASRTAQGLDETVTDLEVLEHIAALLEQGGDDAAA
jgi:hypothetical protein